MHFVFVSFPIQKAKKENSLLHSSMSPMVGSRVLRARNSVCKFELLQYRIDECSVEQRESVARIVLALLREWVLLSGCAPPSLRIMNAFVAFDWRGASCA